MKDIFKKDITQNNPNGYQIARYDNNLSVDYPINKLNETEFNFFMVLIGVITTQAREKRTNELELIHLDFLQKKMLIGKNYTLQEFKLLVINTFKKLNALTIKIENNERVFYLNTFDCFGFDKLNNNDNYIYYRLGRTFEDYFIKPLQDRKNYNTFYIEEINGVKGIYSKRLYEYLKKWRKKGTNGIKRSITFWKELLNIPKGYEDYKIINRIIKPSINELNETKSFIDLTYKKETKNKKLDTIIFYFSSDKDNPKGYINKSFTSENNNLVDDREWNLLLERINNKISEKEYNKQKEILRKEFENKNKNIKHFDREKTNRFKVKGQHTFKMLCLTNENKEIEREIIAQNTNSAIEIWKAKYYKVKDIMYKHIRNIN